MRGFNRVQFQRGKAAQGCKQLLAYVGIFHAGQVFQINGGAFDQPVDLLKGRVLGKARSLVAGAGAKIARKLGYFGHSADSRLGRGCRRARRIDDF